MKIQVTGHTPAHRRQEAQVKKNIARIARAMRIADQPLEVDIFLVGDAFMEKNVLSFPAPRDFPRPDLKGRRSLGEVYLNPAYIKANGEDFNFMLVHGFLHLLGYDHTIKKDRVRMEAMEEKLMAHLRHGRKR